MVGPGDGQIIRSGNFTAIEEFIKAGVTVIALSDSQDRLVSDRRLYE